MYACVCVQNKIMYDDMINMFVLYCFCHFWGNFSKYWDRASEISEDYTQQNRKMNEFLYSNLYLRNKAVFLGWFQHDLGKL